MEGYKTARGYEALKPPVRCTAKKRKKHRYKTARGYEALKLINHQIYEKVE